MVIRAKRQCETQIAEKGLNAGAGNGVRVPKTIANENR